MNKRYGGCVIVGNRISDLLIKKIESSKITCECIWCGDISVRRKSDLEFGKYVKCHECEFQTSNPLYSVWREMNRRCYSENNCNYHKYGKLGIIVADEWKRDCDGGKDGYLNFKNWADSSGYKKGLTLDRINPYSDYNPQNCRWVSYTIQNTNLKIKKLNTSGYVGVSWCDHRGQVGWRARIKVNKKEIQLGVHSSKEKALEVRNKYILNNDLPHKIQNYIGEDGYTKDNYADVFKKSNLYEQCKTCKNLYSSLECEMCEDFDMYIDDK